MSYPEILRRALQLWWRTRALWPLGILAALFGAGDYATGGSTFSFSAPSESLPDGEAAADMLGRLMASELVGAVVANPFPFVVGAAVVLLGWALIATLVGQLAHGAMIRMADVADRGYAASLGDALRVGAARLLPLFLIAILAALPTLLLGGLTIAVAVLAAARLHGAESVGSEAVLTAVGGVLLCGLPLALLTVVVGAVLGLLVRLAQRVCVIEGRGLARHGARSSAARSPRHDRC